MAGRELVSEGSDPTISEGMVFVKWDSAGHHRDEGLAATVRQTVVESFREQSGLVGGC